jgi:hypothetical protein
MEDINRIDTPRRTHVCVACKSVVPERSECSCNDSALIPFGVWQRRRQLLAAGGPQPVTSGTSTAISMAALCALIVSMFFVFVAPPAFAAFCIAVISATLVAGSVSLVREAEPLPQVRRLMPTPVGQSYPVVEGVVLGTPELEAPLTGRACVAFDVTLADSGQEDAQLVARDGMTSGFAIETDDGRRVEIPWGHIVVAGPRQRGAFAETRRYVEQIDPLSPPSDGMGTPYAVAFESIIGVGDRVELHTDVRLVRGSRGVAVYREIANRVYEPVSSPHVRVVRARS